MSIDQDIEDFIKWALSVGCSVDKIPKRDVLRRFVARISLHRALIKFIFIIFFIQNVYFKTNKFI